MLSMKFANASHYCLDIRNEADVLSINYLYFTKIAIDQNSYVTASLHPTQ